MSRLEKLVLKMNWLFLSLFGFLVLLFAFSSDEGGGALAGLATVIALTAAFWLPMAAITSIAGVCYAYRTHESISRLFAAPAIYVLFVVMYILMLILI